MSDRPNVAQSISDYMSNGAETEPQVYSCGLGRGELTAVYNETPAGDPYGRAARELSDSRSLIEHLRMQLSAARSRFASAQNESNERMHRVEVLGAELAASENAREVEKRRFVEAIEEMKAEHDRENEYHARERANMEAAFMRFSKGREAIRTALAYLIDG